MLLIKPMSEAKKGALISCFATFLIKNPSIKDKTTSFIKP